MRYIVIILILFSSCATKQERARKLLDKANKLYPITTMVDTTIKIDTLIKYDTTVVVRVDSIPFFVKVAVPVNGKFSPYREKEVFRNDNALVLASLDEAGTMSFIVKIKPIIKTIKGQISYQDKIKLKKELIRTPPVIIKIRDTIWYIGLGAILITIGFILYRGYKLYKSKLP